MSRRLVLLAASGLSVLAGPALAQTTRVGEVVVTATPLQRPANEVATPVIQLTGEELVRRRQATLGDTLAGLPGVNSDTFGGGASRPVIRGQTAPRVKVLSDSSEMMDASAVSPDHAVTTEPLLLKSIEVLTGPSALLYGGGAVGGAVNLVDSKVPDAVPADGLEGVAEVRAGTNARERAGVVGVTAGQGPFAVRLEAAGRDSDDYKADWGLGRVPGTHNESSTLSAGASLIGEKGYIGAAFTRQESRYGLPGHEHEYESCHPHGATLHCGGHDEGDEDHDHAEGGDDVPVVRLESDRFDLRGEYRDPIAGIERVKLRAGVTDYRHDEVDEGEIATTFRNKGWDGRLEVTHAPFAGWRGVVGLQTADSEFSAEGEEAFLPRTDTRATGLFVYEELTAGDWRIELAARRDWQEIDAVGRPSSSHDPASFSAAAVWTFAPDYSLSLSATRSQRAPSAQELYARGVHLATNTYEIGDPTLDVETANTIDLTLRRTAGDTTFTLGIYQQRIDGYVFADTLDQFEDFRLIRYTQRDARFTGVDGEIKHSFSPVLSAAIFGDYVEAELTDGGGPLPRIPAARLGFHLDAVWRGFSGEVEYAHTFKQDDIAAFETATPGYDMLNATVSKTLPMGDRAFEVYVRGTNLLDDLAYNHASFITRAAPLPGRTLVAGMRASF